MGVSHDCNIQGSPDHPGMPRDHLGNPFPKRDGPWETAGGKEYYSGPQPGLGGIFPFGIVIISPFRA